MNINALSMANSINQTSSTNQTGKKSDKDMFMTLLVTQLKNQDPLEPKDGSEFVAQLAQFNSLDQLVGIKESIDKLAAALQQQHDTPPGSDATV